MDLAANLLERLQSAETQLNLLHFTVQNWIVFQRDSFDIFDEHGDPFTTQIFLIELSTGKYIHRAQGHKADFGVTLDLEILYSKLTEAFINFRVCQGVSLESCGLSETNYFIQEFPYKRIVAPNCQHLFQPSNLSEIKIEPETRWVCPPCQETRSKIEQKMKRPDPDSCLENPVKLEAVLDEDIELFPPTFDAGLEDEDSEESEFDFTLSSESDDDKDDNTFPRASPAEQNTKKRKMNEVQKDEEDNSTRKIYSCNHCNRTFFTGNAYMRHQRKKRKVGCKECDKDEYIITFKQLIEHASKTHPDVAAHYLKYGQNPEEGNSMKVPKKCSLCDMIFNGNLLLYRHREVYHELGDYRCSICHEACLTYYDLAIHNYQKHDQAVDYIQPLTYGLEAVAFQDGKIEYKRESFACQHCDATYTNDSGWTMHMRANHSWDLFECKTCDETCHYAHDFSAHMVNFHPGKPEIKCPTQGCSYVSNLSQDPDVFNKHYRECRKPRNNHKNFPEKHLFQCDTCGKEYFSKTSFYCHIRQHQGIERYKCSHCDFGTNTKTVLIDHEKAHLRDKGLTNADTDLVLYHHCDQCGKEFSQRQSLREHIRRIHMGIKKLRECKDCGQAFHSQSTLYNHKRKMHGFVNTQSMNKGGRRKKKKPSELG